METQPKMQLQRFQRCSVNAQRTERGITPFSAAWQQFIQSNNRPLSRSRHFGFETRLDGHENCQDGEWSLSGVDEQQHAHPILSLCHGIFTDWSIFSTPFLLWKKGSPVTQWRQLVSCDWSWHSHGSLIQGKFDLKINRSMKIPWQKYSGVACSCS